MPISNGRNRVTGEMTSVYTSNLPGDGCGEWLLEQRRSEALAHQEMVALQKQSAANGDRETAAFFKAEASFHRRRYNALLYIIPWFVSDPPKDCRPVTEPWYWPIDLADEFDILLSQAEAHRN